MPKTDMLGVIFTDTNRKSGPFVDSDNSTFYLPFDKDEEYFSVYENEVEFYRGVEKIFRSDPFYNKYISYLREVVGMNTCQVLSNIEVTDKSTVKLEMHHGPILTLFDIVMIICNYHRRLGQTMTTFSVADEVLEEHRLNHCRVVLVSKTAHEEIHANNIILNYRQGFGDTQSFLEKYSIGVDKDMRHRINEYIQWSLQHDSQDNDVLRLADRLKRWGNNDCPDLGLTDY